MVRMVLFLCLTATISYAQRKAASQLEKKGDEAFYYFDYHRSAKYYQDAFAQDSNRWHLRVRIADSYRLAHEPEKALPWYRSALARRIPTDDPAVLLNFSKVLIATGFPEEARQWADAYVKHGGNKAEAALLLDAVTPDDGEKKPSRAVVVMPASFNSPGMDFSPVSFGDGLAFVSSRAKTDRRNSNAGSLLKLFSVAESEDGSFSAPEPAGIGGTYAFHEGPTVFFDDNRQRIITMNHGADVIPSDGDVSRLLLAQSAREPSGRWTRPVPLPFIEPGFSYAHPTISSDGRTLIFSSDMTGSVGASDLFVSHFEKGTWSPPKNLGTHINTTGQELFPYLYKDSLLYFASNGRRGIGGLDLYYVDMRSSSPVVTNLGRPLNSPADDFGISFDPDGNSGFFSSNRPGGKGADDIYFFEAIRFDVEIQVFDSLDRSAVAGASLTLSDDSRPVVKLRTDLSGTTNLRLSPLKNYSLSVSAPGYESRDLRFSIEKDPNEKNILQLPVYLKSTREYADTTSPAILQTRRQTAISNVITFASAPLDVDVQSEVLLPELPVAKDSIEYASARIIAAEVVNNLPLVFLVRNDTLFQFHQTDESTLSNNELDMEFQIPWGAKRHDYEQIISSQVLLSGHSLESFVLIRSFFFDSDKTLLRNDACAQLDKIIDVLHSYPALDVEMTFHSDSRGTDKYNLALSKSRSEEVRAYLMRAGISSQRIESNFVGEGNLLNDCGDLSDCDELLHQINRTVEFKFTLR